MLTPAGYDSVSRDLLRRAATLLEGVSDVSLQDGVVKAEVPGVGTYILSRQPYRREVWLSSAVSGPHHFKLINNAWRNKEGESLFKILSAEVFPGDPLALLE